MPRQERRKQLLGVARKMIQDDGINALTMSALAEEAGASKPVVYEHFDNAEAVAVALLEEYFQTMIEIVATRTADAQSIDDYLGIAVDTQFEFHRADRLVVRSITNGHVSGERVNATYRAMRDRSLETLQDLLAQQGAAPDDARTASYVLWEIITGAVFEFAMRPDYKQAAETVKRMVLASVRAIVPDASAKPITPPRILQAARDIRNPKGN